MSMSTFTKVSFTGLAGVAFSSLTMALSDPAQAASGGFATPYAPADFTTIPNNSNGYVFTGAAPNLIIILAGNNNSGTSGFISYLTTAAADGTVSFDWSYESNEQPLSGSSFGYLLGNNPADPSSVVFTQLTDNNASTVQNNTASFLVQSGQTFGFRINSTNSNNEIGASVNIFEFNGPTGDPTVVPTPALLPGLIGMGVAAWRKRKAEAEAGVTEEV